MAVESPCVAGVLGSEFAGMRKTALRLGQNMIAGEMDLRRHCQRVWKVTRSSTLGAKESLFRLPMGGSLRQCLSGIARHLRWPHLLLAQPVSCQDPQPLHICLQKIKNKRVFSTRTAWLAYLHTGLNPEGSSTLRENAARDSKP